MYPALPGRQLLKWIMHGKTLTRAFLNARLQTEPVLTGIVLDDLGGGGMPTYRKVLRVDGLYVNMDRVTEARPTVAGDLESKLPFADNCVDAVILFNTLEHIYHFPHVTKEMLRILKPGGRVLVYAPFLFPVHTHQTKDFFINDYFRYTEGALHRMFGDAGFGSVNIEPMGGGVLAPSELLALLAPYKAIGVSIRLFGLLLELLYRRISPGSPRRYPLAYYIVARK